MNPALLAAMRPRVQFRPAAPGSELGTPSNLTATPGDSQVSLLWTPAANATSHQPQRRTGTTGSWQNAGSQMGGSASSRIVTGLTNGQLYQFRVQASDGSSTTTSSVVSATPEVSGGGGVEPFFADDFSSGGFSHSEGGFAWGGRRWVTVAQESGRHFARFEFGPDAGDGRRWGELRFSLGGQYTELWIEYWIRYPTNFFHATGNDKFIRLWGVDYGARNKVGASTWGQTGGHGDLRFDRQRPGDGSAIGPSGSPRVSWGESDMRGTWTRVRQHYRYISSPGASDAIFQVWKNDDLAMDWQDISQEWDQDRPYWTAGYLMGSDNSRHSQTTLIDITDVSFYATNPGW